MIGRPFRTVLATAVVASTGLLVAPAARATTGTTIHVNTTADDNTVDGNCSLREALQAANTETAVDACPAGSGGDTVVLGAHTYALTHGELDVSGTVSISGVSAASTTIDDQATSCAQCHIAFLVPSGSHLTLARLDLTRAPTAIVNRGTLDLASVEIDSKFPLVCAGPSRAGGIENEHIARLHDVTITETPQAVVNTAGASFAADDITMTNNGTDAGSGCFETATVLNAGTATIDHATFADDIDVIAADSIDNAEGGSITIRHTRFRGNTPSPTTSAAVVANDGTATIADSAFDENTFPILNGASGGAGTMTIRRTRISTNGRGDNGLAGAIQSEGPLLVTDSTIDHNIGSESGGIIAVNATLVNDTITDNLALCCGQLPFQSLAMSSGGVTNQHVMMVRNTTIARNRSIGFQEWRYAAGGIVTIAGAYTALSNSIVSDNHVAAPLVAPDCFGAFHSLGYNLVGHLAGCFVGDNTTGNVYGPSPGLHPLGVYGGPTMTAPPYWNSPATDAGNPDVPHNDDATTCAVLDQRSVERPRDGDGDRIARCDMGSFER